MTEAAKRACYLRVGPDGKSLICPSPSCEAARRFQTRTTLGEAWLIMPPNSLGGTTPKRMLKMIKPACEKAQ